MNKKNKHSNLTLLKKGELRYPTSPDDAELQTFENLNKHRNFWIKFETPEFTSLCPLTGQPDFANIIINYIPDEKIIESKSLKLYIFSFRQIGTFYEEIVNRIYDDLKNILQPRKIIVEAKFTPRGGITSTITVNSDGEKNR